MFIIFHKARIITRVIILSALFLAGCRTSKTYLVVGYQIVRGDTMNVVKVIKPAQDCKPYTYPVGTILCPGKVKVIK